MRGRRQGKPRGKTGSAYPLTSEKITVETVAYAGKHKHKHAHRDTQRLTHRDTQRHTHRDTQRPIDIHRGTHSQRKQ